MTRLIEVDKFIERMKPYIEKYGAKEFPYYMVHEAFIYEIEQEPTVDAVLVVHGAWRSTEGLYTNGICYCSVCETEYYFSDLYDVGEEAQSRLPNFCPHCGAMMNWKEVATDNAKMDGEA